MTYGIIITPFAKKRIEELYKRNLETEFTIYSPQSWEEFKEYLHKYGNSTIAAIISSSTSYQINGIGANPLIYVNNNFPHIPRILIYEGKDTNSLVRLINNADLTKCFLPADDPDTACQSINAIIEQFHHKRIDTIQKEREKNEILIKSLETFSAGLIDKIKRNINNIRSELIKPGQLNVTREELRAMIDTLKDIQDMFEVEPETEHQLDLLLTLKRFKHDFNCKARQTSLRLVTRDEEAKKEPFIINATAFNIFKLLEYIVDNAIESQASLIQIDLKYDTFIDTKCIFLTIANDGKPIDIKDLPYIKRPFYTSKPGHYGLGLTAVSIIAYKIGGWVFIMNCPDSDPLFTVKTVLIFPVKKKPLFSMEVFANNTIVLEGKH